MASGMGFINATALKEASTRQLEQFYEQAQGNRQLLQALMLELVQRPSQQAQSLCAEIQVELYRLEQGESDEIIDWDEVITTQARQLQDRAARAEEFTDRLQEPLQRALGVLDAWMVTETLTPQVFKQPEDLAQRGTFLPLAQDVPWGKSALGLTMKPPNEGQSIFYQVYLGDINVRDAQEELLELYGPDPDPELKGTEGSAVLALATFNEQGVLVGEYGVGIACFGWSFGRARLEKIQHLPFWHSAERLLVRKLRKRLSPVDEDQRPKPVSYENLQDAADWLTHNLDLPIDSVQPVRFAVRLVQSSKKRPPSSPLLNSFLLQDLWRAKAALEKQRGSSALLQYLQVQPATSSLHSRQDLLALVRQNLKAHGLPPSRWPSASAQSLDALQQTAVNLTLQKQSALFSVHGPPGTGKTTLLRDIVAGVLGQRADVLAAFEYPGDAFKAKVVMKIGDQRYDVHPLDDRLLGHEMLVCSRNNKAVENISLELPLKREVSQECADLNYFAQTMQAYLSEKSARRETEFTGQADLFAPSVFEFDQDEPWGLIATALGNGANRQAYVRGVWLDPGHGFKHYFEQMIADWKDDTQDATQAPAAHGHSDFAARSESLFLPTSEAEALQLWRDARADYCACRAKILAMGQDLELQMNDLDGLYALSVPQEFVQARDEFFLAVLRLHQAFILASPHQLLDNINGFTRILLGARGSKPELLPHLWASGMLITPVISTTFASLQRMLHDMPPASLGWVLIDEAGQASPQDAVGALTRARQAIVVGDPKQIEPVVSLPHGLVSGIANYFSLDPLEWMAPDMSVQTLADRVNPFGLQLQGVTTVGWPILVHRRCAEPMFTMMNTLAYEGMMVQGLDRSNKNQNKPVSQWLHVVGESSNKWCDAEGEVALRLVQHLLGLSGNTQGLNREKHNQNTIQTVFVISPFRNVAVGLKQLFRKHKKLIKACGLGDVNHWIRENIGTVHTFQGRQATNVIFVLGAQGADEGAARHWATRQVNLCNVAVSRAQQSLFVIGNQELWQSLGAMRIISNGLEKTSPELTHAFACL